MVLGNETADWQLLVLLGCLSGFLSGLLGIGGGLILVPGLMITLPYFGVDGPELTRIAMATSLALIVPTSMASIQAHALKGAIDLRLFALLGPGIVAGAVVAPIFASAISSTVLTALFVLFALNTARTVMRGSSRQAMSDHNAGGNKPGIFRVTLTCLFGGALSSLLGLGVSWFTVPMLERFGPMPRAIGTTAALCLPMAVFGIAGFVLLPTPAECPSGCRGYVYLPAVAATGISAVLAAPMGARLTHVLPVRTLRNLFALFLIMAAGNLTYKSLPVTSTANEARMLIVRLLAPDLKAAPMAAEAPSWLDVKRHMARLELAARYGPRLALLAGNAPASPPVRFLTQLVPPPDEGLEAWYHARILKARGSLQRRSTRAELAMPLPERAIRTAGLVSYKRRAPRRKVKQQAKPSSTRSIEKRNPCNDKNLARSPRQEGGQNRIQDCETNVAAPPPAVAEPSEFDPFGLLGAPGSGGQPFSWSK